MTARHLIVGLGSFQSVPISNRSRFSKVMDWEKMAKEACYCAPELAHLCGVSLRHLQRHFHDVYGLKLRTWLNELRLCHAYELLLASQSVKEVAFELGFKQLSHFSREFKRFHGVSPSVLQTGDAENPLPIRDKFPVQINPPAGSIPASQLELSLF